MIVFGKQESTQAEGTAKSVKGKRFLKTLFDAFNEGVPLDER